MVDEGRAALSRAAVVVVAAGGGGRPGESRLGLLGRNVVVVVRDVMRNLLSRDFGGVVLMTTNPVDVLADELLRRVRRAAPDIIERKGYTSYAIASCVARICEAVLRDERSVLPVSTRLNGQYGIDGVYLSLPCVVGRGGVERVIEIPLDERERDGLRASADLLRRTVETTRGGDPGA